MNKRRFWPLFVTQFLGAFNDNFFKTALVVLLAYGLVQSDMAAPETLVSIAAGVFILPFLMLTPLGGVLADKYDKAALIQWIKIAEIFIVIATIFALFSGSVLALLGALFLFGAQSALFSPSKFAILPQHLNDDELIGGNALVNTGTYLSILLGTIAGTILIVDAFGQMMVMALLMICALIGYIASRFIPPAPASSPDLTIGYNAPLEAARIIRAAAARPQGVFTAIVAHAYFFFVGGLYLAQLPNYTSQVLKVDNVTLTFFLAVFSLGIAAGGLLNNTLLKSKVKATFVPWAALGISVFSLDLFFASHVHGAQTLRGLGEFLSSANGWRIAFDLLAVSVCGGLYAVPLKTMVQTRTPDDHMARTLAAGALLDAFFVLLSAIAAVILYSVGFEAHHLFLMVGVLIIPVAFYATKLTDKILFWEKKS